MENEKALLLPPLPSLYDFGLFPPSIVSVYMNKDWQKYLSQNDCSLFMLL